MLQDDETLPLESSGGTLAEVKELPPVEADSYEIVRELGRGGMGRVLLASDRRLRRDLALKISLSTDASSRTRFAREALLTARLQHPSIVPVHEAGTWAKAGQPFYAMKVVDGRSLVTLIEETKTLDERLALIPNVIAVVDALAFAHAKRVIHRDLKPSNVIVGDYGETIVIDWGLAKELGVAETIGPSGTGSGGETIEGAAMGTPPYMSPEQAAGERVDERVDVYGLGAMLYHVLCGAPPYRGVEVMAQVLAGPPQPLAERAPGIPRDLLAIVDKAMARDQADRYRDAGALGEDLKRFFRGQLVAAHAYSRWELVGRWLRKHRAMVSVVTLAIVALAIASIVGVTRVVRERNVANALAQELLVETGRSQLELGHPIPAAAALAKAAPDPTNRMMLAAAMRPLDAEVARYDAGSRVRRLAFTADGAALVSIGDNAQLWDIATGTSRMLDLGDAEPREVGTHDTRIAIGLADGGVRIFDARTGALILQLAGGHTSAVRDLRFSPDGTRIVTSAFMDKHFVLWNASDGTQIARAHLGEAALGFVVDGKFPSFDNDRYDTVDVTAKADQERIAGASDPLLAFFPDGRFVTATPDGQIAVWSRDGALLGAEFISYGSRILSLAVAPERIAVGGNGYALLFAGYRTKDGWANLGLRRRDHVIPLRVDPKRDVRAIAFSDDVVAVGDGITVRTFDAAYGHPYGARDDDGNVEALVFAGRSRLVSVGDGRFAHISDARGAPLWRLEGAQRLAVVTGDRLATAGFGNEIRIWNLAAGPVRDVAQTTTEAIVDFAGDGRFAIVDRGQIRLGTKTFGTDIQGATFGPDGHTLATMNQHGAQLWRDDGTLVRELEDPGRSLTHATFVLDGARVIGTSSSTDDYAVFKVWDVATGKIVESVEEHPSDFPPSVSADRRRYATFGKPVTVWDAATNAAIARFEMPSPHAALSPDGTRIAIAREDGTTEIYALPSKLLVRTLGGHAARVTYVDYTAAHILTASGDGTARLWTGDRALVLAGHRGEVTCAKLSPDGTLVATGGDDGTLRIWDARDGRQLLSFDNGSQVFALGWSPAGDAVFASTAIRTADHPNGRAAVFSLAREARSRAEIERVVARFAMLR